MGSIGSNLTPTPEPSEFFDLFKRIAARSDVADVRRPDYDVRHSGVAVQRFSDTVWVMTSAAPEEVSEWFDEEVRPDERWQGWNEGVKFESYSVPPGMHPVACWWD